MFSFISHNFSLYIIYPEKPKHLKRIGRYRNDRFQRNKKYINTSYEVILYLSMYLCYLNKFPSLNYTHKIMFSFITNNFRYILFILISQTTSPQQPRSNPTHSNLSTNLHMTDLTEKTVCQVDINTITQFRHLDSLVHFILLLLGVRHQFIVSKFTVLDTQ